MDKAQWDRWCMDVCNQMFEHVKPFVTPISKVFIESGEQYGEHWGSGSFLEIDGSKYLITNEHVGRGMIQNPLAHQFLNSDVVVRLTNPVIAEVLPIDVALMKIEERVWNINAHDSRGIPIDRFAAKHQPVDGEILFIIGYGGDYSKFYFNALHSPGSPYLTQICDFPLNFGDPNFHFAIHYRPDLAFGVDGTTRGLPMPPGMSGSLVWNTRAVEYLSAEKIWTPKAAQVTGIVWGWPSSAACLLATKVEHLSLDEMRVKVNKISS